MNLIINKKEVIMAKFCPNCGHEMADEHKVCSNCGMPYQNHINQMNVQSYQQPSYYNPGYQQPYGQPYGQPPMYYQQPVEQHAEVGWVILAVLIPIVGWIFCGIWSGTKPKTAKCMGIAATISFIVNLALSFFLPVILTFLE